jgi:hypothetical protein
MEFTGDPPPLGRYVTFETRQTYPELVLRLERRPEKTLELERAGAEVQFCCSVS